MSPSREIIKRGRKAAVATSGTRRPARRARTPRHHRQRLAPREIHRSRRNRSRNRRSRRRAHALRQQHHPPKRRRAWPHRLHPHRHRRPHRARHNESHRRRFAARRDRIRTLACAQPAQRSAPACRCPASRNIARCNRFAAPTAAITPEDRARAVKRACDLAISQRPDRRRNFRQRHVAIRDGQFARPFRQLSRNPRRILDHDAGIARRKLGESKRRECPRLRSAKTCRHRQPQSASRTQRAGTRSRQIHRNPRAIRRPRSRRLPLLRFRRHRTRRQTLLPQRPHGQAHLRQKYQRHRRRLSPVATRRTFRRRRRAARKGRARRSRHAEESRLLARHRQKSRRKSPPATASRCPTNTAKRR